MSQTASNPTTNLLLKATVFMVAAQVIFAGVNFSYDVITNPWNALLPDQKMSSSAAVFWQYAIATLFAIPLIMRIGLKHLKTRHPVLHELRALASALGAQVFVFGFATGVPVWQMVGLLLVGPFFVMIGSAMFLGEKLTRTRILMTIVAFIGAFMIVGFGSDAFTLGSLLPMLAAALWASTTIISKYLSREESPESLTLYLLLLISVNHAIIGLILGVLILVLPAGALPASLSTGFDFAFPSGDTVYWIIGLGFITALSQYFLWSAYNDADATYLQPFDDLKLPLNVLLGWVVLSQIPGIWFWPGAALVVGASLYIAAVENSAKEVSL